MKMEIVVEQIDMMSLSQTQTHTRLQRGATHNPESDQAQALADAFLWTVFFGLP